MLSEYKEREKTNKVQINLVVVGMPDHTHISHPLTYTVFTGHVDAGKSTLMGHLLFLLGNVSKKSMHK